LRTFIALNIPPAERQALHDATRAIREAAGPASWVAPENLHLTLKFLGEVDDERAILMGDRLRSLGAAHRPLVLDVGGADVFPNFRAPRIVWMGVAPEAKLELLYHDVERECEALGFAAEGRAFRPHLTLGRIKAPPASEVRRALAEAMRECTFRTRIAVDSVDLMASALGRPGSRYSVMVAAPLGEER
jgi:2'-5' RNA ligase